MSKFAEYTPHAHGERDKHIEVRLARLADLAELAEINAEREGCDTEQSRARFERELNNPELARTLWIAETTDSVIAFARLRFLQRPEDAPHNHQPTGWYLGGVIVRPEYRRRGVARELTRVRLNSLEAEGVRQAFFGSNSLNRASIDLHNEFGFEECMRDFYAPGVTFTGGVGILFRAQLQR